MTYTEFQKESMKYVSLARVHYRDMWKTKGEIGYVQHGSPSDHIYIARDIDDACIRKIALLHECGHVMYNHTSVNSREESEFIREVFERKGKPFSLVSVYGGVHNFLNICMDLEVNSKLLTIGNTRYMVSHGFEICTPESFDVEVLDGFRDYYEPLIEKIPDDNEESEKMKQSISRMLENMMKDISESQGEGNGNGKESSSSEGEDKEDEGNPSMSVGEILEEEESSNNEGEDGTDEMEGSSSSSSAAGCGKDSLSGSTGIYDIRKNCSSVIASFLGKIVRPSMIYRPDSMRHSNRGSRENSGNLMYSSIRRRNRTDRKRMVIILDVSGSMDVTSVITALGSIRSSLGYISEESSVLVWNTSKMAEFPVGKIPLDIPKGGGTDMAAALQYAVEDMKADIVCMYSDFCTPIEPMVEILMKSKVDMHSIAVSEYPSGNKKTFSPSYSEKDSWRRFIKRNRDWILVG